MMWDPGTGSLTRATLHHLYQAGALRPEMVLDAIYRRIAARGDDHVWISLIPRHEAMARATQLAARRTASEVLPPLWGLPFAIKDNIDVAEVPTTAACPAYAYIPDDSATVVDRLIAAGAIPIGKTNLDQFATGLVGVRSPYGVPANPFHPAYIPGGSSSGSAVTVATGLVSFALGTDTAGSGRIPAAFCNVVGLKPTRGLIPTVGLVPACRSLDCVSISPSPSRMRRQCSQWPLDRTRRMPSHVGCQTVAWLSAQYRAAVLASPTTWIVWAISRRRTSSSKRSLGWNYGR